MIEAKVLTPEEIEAIRHEITPIDKIRHKPKGRLISREAEVSSKGFRNNRKLSEDIRYIDKGGL